MRKRYEGVSATAGIAQHTHTPPTAQYTCHSLDDVDGPFAQTGGGTGLGPDGLAVEVLESQVGAARLHRLLLQAAAIDDGLRTGWSGGGYDNADGGLHPLLAPPNHPSQLLTDAQSTKGTAPSHFLPLQPTLKPFSLSRNLSTLFISF